MKKEDEIIPSDMESYCTVALKTLQITKKEAAKVTHDINNVWHVRYSTKTGRVCAIYTHSHESESPSYAYYFINRGFGQYDFIAKYPTADRR